MEVILEILGVCLSIYGGVALIWKFAVRDKVESAEVPDIIDAGRDCVLPNLEEKNKSRNKWYYKLRKFF